MHLFSKVIGTIAIAFLFINTSYGQGISMSPTRLFFTGHSGQVLTKTVILTNNSSKEFLLNIHSKDWERNLNGDKIYYNSGTLKNSNTNWMSTVESTIKIPAGESKEVVVTLKVPQDASNREVTNSMLFFTQIAQQDDKSSKEKNIGIRTLIEFGLHVYYTPEGNTNKSLNIMAINKSKEDSTKILDVKMQNDGNVICDASVEFELTDINTGKEFKIKPINISMMPGTEQFVHFNLPEDLKGKYLGVALVKIGESNDMRVGEIHLEY